VRSWLRPFTFDAPKDLTSALRLLSDDPGAWRPFAGGTDLMVLLESGKLPPGKYVSIWGLSELRGITITSQEVALGALTTYTDVLSHPLLRSEFPLLCAAAQQTGGIATQNRGTLGGNIANASPAADSPPALLVYDAELELLSARGTRRVAYDGFHSGYRVMDLAPGEIISRIIIPRRHPAWRQTYRKIGTRNAQAISKVCFAAAVDLDGSRVRDVRVALGSVAPMVIRCVRAETALRGHSLDADFASAAAAALALDIAPIDDFRSTARYRLRVAQNLLIQFLARLRLSPSEAPPR
jgi:CO/xanthine dehydrogenase FAD-binding subunit